MTPRQQGSSPFTSADAYKALTAACREVGLPSEDAQLVRLGENAIYRLTKAAVIVRIARSAEVLPDAKKEVAVASWLREAGLPAAEPTDHGQPIISEGRPVTFWKLIDDSGIKASISDLARILRQLHRLSVPHDLPLPQFDIFGRASQRISKAHVLTDEERDFLIRRLNDLRNQYATLKFPLRPSAVHGDAHQSNLIKSLDGTVFLIDFEAFAFGPPEYDLSITATEQRIGWHTDEQYSKFVKAYGFDIKDWEGFPIVCSINELKMTTWLMQNVNESADVAQEFRIRLASLFDDGAPRPWSPF